MRPEGDRLKRRVLGARGELANKRLLDARDVGRGREVFLPDKEDRDGWRLSERLQGGSERRVRGFD